MIQLCENILPILMLLAFGWILRRRDYFDEGAVKALNRLISQILIPCVIFNSIYTMDIRSEHLRVTVGFVFLLTVILAVNYGAYKIFRWKRKFLIFFPAAFSFGLSGIPLFVTVFGADHMDYLVAMGIGHELFFAVVYLTAARIVLQGEAMSFKKTVKSLASPLLLMVLIALVLNLSGLRDTINSSLAGSCIILFIQKLGSVTSVLTMIVVGYRIHFEDLSKLKESVGIVVYRYLMTFSVAYAVKMLILDRMIEPTADFNHAFFTMISLFGSTMLIVLTGQYGSEEDTEICSNAFVINVLASIPVFLGYVLWIQLASYG